MGENRCFRLKVLPVLAFEKFHYLETLNLQNNDLLHVPEEAVAPFLDTMDFIDMSRNPLVCDCDLAWYREWYEKRHRKTGGIGMGSGAVFAGSPETMNTAKCYKPNSFTEYEVHKLSLKDMGCVGKVYDSKPNGGTPTPNRAPALLIGTAAATAAAAAAATAAATALALH